MDCIAPNITNFLFNNSLKYARVRPHEQTHIRARVPTHSLCAPSQLTVREEVE